MSPTYPISASLAPVTRLITVDDIHRYLTRKGWTPVTFSAPTQASYFQAPANAGAPPMPAMLAVSPRGPHGLQGAIDQLARIEGRPPGEILIEIAEPPEGDPLSPFHAVSFVPERFRAPLYAALREGKAATEALASAHVPWCSESGIPVVVAKCSCAAAMGIGRKAIAELEARVHTLRVDLAVACGEIPAPLPEALTDKQWRYLHVDWKTRALTWIEEQATQLHTLVGQLRTGPFADDEERIAIGQKAQALEGRAVALQALVDHARRWA